MNEFATRRLAISNIAWNKAEDDAAMAFLIADGVQGLEIAPTRLFSDPLSCPDALLEQYRRNCEIRGIRIVAMQSLLFGRADLTIFESQAARSRTLDYLTRILDFGQRLGVSVAVFGSPQNRRVGSLERDRAQDVAVSFFQMLGREAYARDMWFCIEPNPVAYGCDFLTTTAEAVTFLTQAATPGLGLHLDAAAMTLSGDKAEEAIPNAASLIRHFHVSEPNLAVIGSGGVDHASFSRALALANYKGWLSIEMRAGDANLDNIATALTIARGAYASVL